MRHLLFEVTTLLCVVLVTSTSPRQTPPTQSRQPLHGRQTSPSASGHFNCRHRPDGTYPDLEDCTKFYKCKSGLAWHFRCPEGYYFDTVTYICIGSGDTCAECPEFSYWSSCKGNCKPTCAIPNPSCSEICTQGCACYPGYVWHGDECIAEHMCHYKQSAGQREANEPETPMRGPTRPPSPGMSRAGVPECKYGAVYDEETGQCVCQLACPRHLDPVCGSDGQEHANECFMKAAACESQQDIYITGRPPCLPSESGNATCPTHSHWNPCDADCVATCFDRTPDCPQMCGKPGCSCDEGFVWQLGKCIPLRHCPPIGDYWARCHQPKDPGPCNKKIPRFFFNYHTSLCEPFIYGGCLGNENNHQSVTECNMCLVE